MENYLNTLKIAVINKDIKKLQQVVKNKPVFESVDEAKEILAYIQQAVELLQKEKNKLSSEMEKIKKLQKFNSDQLNNKNSKEVFDFKA